MGRRNELQVQIAAFAKQNFTLSEFSKFLKHSLSALLFAFTTFLSQAQEVADQIVIDEKGVMHWRETGEEVTGFGVNYTVPFAHAYPGGI
jgi:hypothetical protein